MSATPDDLDVRVRHCAHANDDLIERRLVAALRANVPPSDAAPLAVELWDGEVLAAGLVGSTAYGWLLVKILWVEDTRRSQGLGARLMAVAETEARALGCHGAWLGTSSARAASFYRRLGYSEFGALENGPGEAPHGHRRAFLMKRL